MLDYATTVVRLSAYENEIKEDFYCKCSVYYIKELFVTPWVKQHCQNQLLMG